MTRPIHAAVLEGYGLQPVRKCFALNSALAAEARLSQKRSDEWMLVVAQNCHLNRSGVMVPRLIQEDERRSLLHRATKAGCPIQARFWLEWDTTALDVSFLSLGAKPRDLRFPRGPYLCD